MSWAVKYRPALDGDFDYCRVHHHQGMKPYVEPIWVWSDEFQNERFQKLWRPERIKVIQLDDKDVGYIEVLSSVDLVKLVNVFLADDLRGKGIGTKVISDFILEYQGKASKLTLNVLWNNPAKNLYERLGFQFVSREDQILKYEFTSEPSEKSLLG